MRAWSPASNEALRARNLLKDWAGEGFLSGAQHQRMEQETPCDLRRTNVFLRVVLGIFTLIIAVAAVALFSTVFLSRPSAHTNAVVFLFFAAIYYAAAEVAVSRFHLYRHGMEEALLACAVTLFCMGLRAAFFTGSATPASPDATVYVVPVAGAVASLWIWLRFGFLYAFGVAMVLVLWLPGYWTASHSAQHVSVAAIYAAGLIAVIARRSRHPSDSFDDDYGSAEAFLWLGIYLAINLQLSSVNLLGQWQGGLRTAPEFSTLFYWFTWVVTWCLPPAVIARGLHRKDRVILATGALLAILTLVTTKPYFGWPRQTWDPMLLGALLTGVALFLRRWLADGPQGMRNGFTAQRMSGNDKRWISAGSAALGFLPLHAIPPAQPATPDVHFGGGDSAGGGATSEF